MRTPAFGVVCLQEGPQPLAPAKGSLSLEGARLGANGREGALRTVRPTTTSLELTTTPQGRARAAVVGEPFPGSALAASGYATTQPMWPEKVCSPMGYSLGT